MAEKIVTALGLQYEGRARLLALKTAVDMVENNTGDDVYDLVQNALDRLRALETVRTYSDGNMSTDNKYVFQDVD